MIERGEERKGREQEQEALPSFHGTEDKHLSAADKQILSEEKKGSKIGFIYSYISQKIGKIIWQIKFCRMN